MFVSVLGRSLAGAENGLVAACWWSVLKTLKVPGTLIDTPPALAILPSIVGSIVRPRVSILVSINCCRAQVKPEPHEHPPNCQQETSWLHMTYNRNTHALEHMSGTCQSVFIVSRTSSKTQELQTNRRQCFTF